MHLCLSEHGRWWAAALVQHQRHTHDCIDVESIACLIVGHWCYIEQLFDSIFRKCFACSRISIHIYIHIYIYIGICITVVESSLPQKPLGIISSLQLLTSICAKICAHHVDATLVRLKVCVAAQAWENCACRVHRDEHSEGSVHITWNIMLSFEKCGEPDGAHELRCWKDRRPAKASCGIEPTDCLFAMLTEWATPIIN